LSENKKKLADRSPCLTTAWCKEAEAIPLSASRCIVDDSRHNGQAAAAAMQKENVYDKEKDKFVLGEHFADGVIRRSGFSRRRYSCSFARFETSGDNLRASQGHACPNRQIARAVSQANDRRRPITMS
jgi:hypothetical protein